MCVRRFDRLKDRRAGSGPVARNPAPARPAPRPVPRHPVVADAHRLPVPGNPHVLPMSPAPPARIPDEAGARRRHDFHSRRRRRDDDRLRERGRCRDGRARADQYFLQRDPVHFFSQVRGSAGMAACSLNGATRRNPSLQNAKPDIFLFGSRGPASAGRARRRRARSRTRRTAAATAARRTARSPARPRAAARETAVTSRARRSHGGASTSAS